MSAATIIIAGVRFENYFTGITCLKISIAPTIVLILLDIISTSSLRIGIGCVDVDI